MPPTLNAIRRHKESVLTSTPANALQPYLQNDNDWDQGQIFFTPNQTWGMPPFHAQRMQAENHLPLRVRSTVKGSLDVTATRNEAGHTLIIHAVNPGADAIDTKLELNGFKNRLPTADRFMLAGDLNARNTPAEPNHIKTLVSRVLLKDERPVYNFPAHSYTVLKFARSLP